MLDIKFIALGLLDLPGCGFQRGDWAAEEQSRWHFSARQALSLPHIITI